MLDKHQNFFRFRLTFLKFIFILIKYVNAWYWVEVQSYCKIAAKSSRRQIICADNCRGLTPAANRGFLFIFKVAIHTVKLT